MELESTRPHDNKKLIWALETSERHGRPVCGDCTDRLKAKRGCKKPGMNVDGKMAFVFTSPRLHNDDDARILRECPVGAVLKNAPHVYDVLGVWRYSDNAGMAIQSQPKWLREAFRVIDAEKSRLTELSKQDNQSKRDAAFARRAVKGAQ